MLGNECNVKMDDGMYWWLELRELVSFRVSVQVPSQKMAPSPENDNEPKAPDKSDSKKSTSGNVSKLGADLLDLDSSSTADPQVSLSGLNSNIPRPVHHQPVIQLLQKPSPGAVWVPIRLELPQARRNPRYLVVFYCPLIFANVSPVPKTYPHSTGLNKWPLVKNHASTCCDNLS